MLDILYNLSLSLSFLSFFSLWKGRTPNVLVGKPAEEKIEHISEQIFNSKLLADKNDLRVGLVAYRDYAPQDFQEFTTRPYPFTSDIEKIKSHLSELKANGGGDGPEAAASALYAAIHDMKWRTQGARMIVLITDAAPHGVNPFAKSGDGEFIITTLT
jgi:hypothetical protein